MVLGKVCKCTCFWTITSTENFGIYAVSNGEKQPVEADEKNLHKFKTTGQLKSEKSRKRSGLWFIHI